jgi:O-antigen/teichoic acid export membrane protein
MRSIKAIRGSGVLLLQMAARIAVPFIVSRLLLHSKGAESLGAYAVIMEIVGYLLLLDLGFSQALTREVAQLPIGGSAEKEKLTEMTSTAQSTLFAIGVIVCLVLVGLALSVDLWLSSTAATSAASRSALLMLAVWMPLRFPLSWFQALLYARQRIDRYALSDLLGELLRTLGSVAVVSIGWGLPGLAFITIVSQLLSFGLCFLWSRDLIALRWPPTFSFDFVKRIMRIGFPMALMSLGDRLSFLSQNATVGILFSARAASSFYATRAAPYFAGSVIWRLSDSIFPGINNLYGERLHDRLRSAFIRLTGYALGAAVWVAVTAVVINRQFVSAWLGGPLYSGASVTIAVSLLVVILCLKTVITKFMILGEALGSYAVLVFAEGVIAISLAVALSRWLGPAAVAWAAAAASLVTLPYLIYRTSHFLRPAIRAGYGELLAIAVKASAGGIVAALLVAALPHPRLAAIVLLRDVAVIAAAGGLWFAMFGLTPPDRHALFSTIAAFSPRADRTREGAR